MRFFRVVTGTSGSFLCKDVEESSVWTCCALHIHSSEQRHFLFLPYGALTGRGAKDILMWVVWCKVVHFMGHWPQSGISGWKEERAAKFLGIATQLSPRWPYLTLLFQFLFLSSRGPWRV